MNRPLVSCIIPTRNRAAFLPMAVESVLNQTWKDLEVIIVDDGSTDNTIDKIRYVTSRDNRVRFLRNEVSAGPSAARNRGMAVAEGSVIAFLDDDDQWMPDRLLKNLTFLQNFDLSVCAIAQKGGRRPNRRAGRLTLEDMIRGNRFGGASAIMGRAGVLQGLGFDESLFFGEDWDLMLRAAKQYKLGYLAEPLVAYNTGMHQRLTTGEGKTEGPVVGRDRVIRKHRGLFGRFYYRFHMADNDLSFLAARTHPMRALVRAAGKWGVGMVARVLLRRAFNRISGRLCRQP